MTLGVKTEITNPGWAVRWRRLQTGIYMTLGVTRGGIRRAIELPRFLGHLRDWRRRGGRISALFPIIGEWAESSGSARGHYFHMDLLVARRIFENKPQRHLDVGSRIDGFVAHVAVFRQIEVVDIRPNAESVGNIVFRQGDLLNLDPTFHASCDSLSCLHALEHIGLGRYGDPIDPDGHLKGFAALVRMLKPGGRFYLAFPIGRAGVEFNAHRIFDPEEVFAWPGAESLALERFDYVDDSGRLHEAVARDRIRAECGDFAYGCGIYAFVKSSAA